MVELMLDDLLGLDKVVSVSGVGEGETPICWEMEGGGRISPVALMSVVGEIGAGVLNSNAR